MVPILAPGKNLFTCLHGRFGLHNTDWVELLDYLRGGTQDPERLSKLPWVGGRAQASELISRTSSQTQALACSVFSLASEMSPAGGAHTWDEKLDYGSHTETSGSEKAPST